MTAFEPASDSREEILVPPRNRAKAIAYAFMLVFLGHGASSPNQRAALSDILTGPLHEFIVTHDEAAQKQAFASLLKRPPPPAALQAALDAAYRGQDQNQRNRVLYLIARLRPSHLGRRLLGLVSRSSDTGDRCVYSCPEALALTLYAAFTNEVEPAAVRSAVAGDELSRLDYIRAHPAPGHADLSGPAVDSLVEHAKHVSEAALIAEASDPSLSANARYVALEELSASVSSATHLDDFYWLALAAPTDASGESVTAAHGAIMRAELAKYAASKNGKR